MATLYDTVVRHQVYLEGLKLGTAAQFNLAALKLNTDIRNELAGLTVSSIGDMSRRALLGLIQRLKAIALKHFTVWFTDIIKFLEDFMDTDFDLYSHIIAATGAFDKEPEQPDDKHKAFLAYMALPMAAVGLAPAAFLKSFMATSMGRIQRAVNMASVDAVTPSALSAILTGTNVTGTARSSSNTTAAQANLSARDGLVSTFQRQAQAATSTVVQHISAQVASEVNGSLTDKYIWISVIDSATTPICFSRNGNIYIVGKGPVPPAHVGCRSTTLPDDGEPAPHESFSEFIDRQPQDFVDDAFDGKRTKTYEGTKALTLSEFAGKEAKITA